MLTVEPSAVHTPTQAAPSVGSQPSRGGTQALPIFPILPAIQPANPDNLPIKTPVKNVPQSKHGYIPAPIMPAVAQNAQVVPLPPKPQSNRPRSMDIKFGNMKGINVHIHNIKGMSFKGPFKVIFSSLLRYIRSGSEF